MNIRELASRFSVYVFARDVDRGAGIKVALSAAGYDAYFFEDQTAMVERVASTRPHIVVLSTNSVRDSLSSLVEEILRASPETRFIFLARKDQFETVSAYGAYGLEDFTADDPEGLSPRVLFSVDRACERLYLGFQNEALLRELEKEKARPAPASKTGGGVDLDSRVRSYLGAGSKEEILQKFMEGSSEQRLVYLKYLPTVKSLVVTHATAKDMSALSGLGCQLSSEEGASFAKEVTLGFVPPSLQEMLTQALGSPKVILWPLFLQKQLEGVLALPQGLPEASRKALQGEFSLLSVMYSNFAMERRLEALEVQDPITEVYNRGFYQKKLAEEWSRARRIRQALCVVKIALDDFFELEQALGESARDALLRNLAQLMLKTSRTNDITCRTGLNEFALILPHCNRQGGMIRAERLRRYIENSQVLDNGLKISISLGISEYPTLCSTPEELDASSSKALSHILDRGGNRLCLFKAPPSHRPEFEVPAEGSEA